MNPILLKPSSDKTSQVVLNGKPIGNKNAFEYFHREGRSFFRKAAHEAFDRLRLKYNPIVIEGAGSVSEINLREQDIVNMPMAIYAGADVLLVADIDRGGVFASVYGSILLMTEEERRRVKGILINKFRGDIRLFESGVKMLEKLCQVPVLGVIPYYKDIVIEEEDSVCLRTKNLQATIGKVNIAVILLRHLSNFTDFNRLELDERVNLYYTNNTDEIVKADIIILPGSKSTIDDLYELRRNGVAHAILHASRAGTTVLGICGGYQMMGREILDPLHQEGNQECMPGLGLLPVMTRLTDKKTTRQVKFHFLDKEEECIGYEIHQGVSVETGDIESKSFASLADGTKDGCWMNHHCMGTYLHGILDNQSFVDYLLEPFAEKVKQRMVFDYAAFKEEQYDKLAALIRSHVNMPLLYKIMKRDD